jgi:hypothetical protein
MGGGAQCFFGLHAFVLDDFGGHIRQNPHTPLFAADNAKEGLSAGVKSHEY